MPPQQRRPQQPCARAHRPSVSSVVSWRAADAADVASAATRRRPPPGVGRHRASAAVIRRASAATRRPVGAGAASDSDDICVAAEVDTEFRASPALIRKLEGLGVLNEFGPWLFDVYNIRTVKVLAQFNEQDTEAICATLLPSFSATFRELRQEAFRSQGAARRGRLVDEALDATMPPAVAAAAQGGTSAPAPPAVATAAEGQRLADACAEAGNKLEHVRDKAADARELGCITEAAGALTTARQAVNADPNATVERLLGQTLMSLDGVLQATSHEDLKKGKLLVQDAFVLACARGLPPEWLEGRSVHPRLKERLRAALPTFDLQLFSRLGTAKYKLFCPPGSWWSSRRRRRGDVVAEHSHFEGDNLPEQPHGAFTAPQPHTWASFTAWSADQARDQEWAERGRGFGGVSAAGGTVAESEVSQEPEPEGAGLGAGDAKGAATDEEVETGDDGEVSERRYNSPTSWHYKTVVSNTFLEIEESQSERGSRCESVAASSYHENWARRATSRFSLHGHARASKCQARSARGFAPQEAPRAHSGLNEHAQRAIAELQRMLPDQPADEVATNFRELISRKRYMGELTLDGNTAEAFFQAIVKTIKNMRDEQVAAWGCEALGKLASTFPLLADSAACQLTAIAFTFSESAEVLKACVYAVWDLCVARKMVLGLTTSTDMPPLCPRALRAARELAGWALRCTELEMPKMAVIELITRVDELGRAMAMAGGDAELEMAVLTQVAWSLGDALTHSWVGDEDRADSAYEQQRLHDRHLLSWHLPQQRMEVSPSVLEWVKQGTSDDYDVVYQMRFRIIFCGIVFGGDVVVRILFTEIEDVIRCQNNGNREGFDLAEAQATSAMRALIELNCLVPFERSLCVRVFERIRDKSFAPATPACHSAYVGLLAVFAQQAACASDDPSFAEELALEVVECGSSWLSSGAESVLYWTTWSLRVILQVCAFYIPEELLTRSKEFAENVSKDPHLQSMVDNEDDYTNSSHASAALREARKLLERLNQISGAASENPLVAPDARDGASTPASLEDES